MFRTFDPYSDFTLVGDISNYKNQRPISSLPIIKTLMLNQVPCGGFTKYWFYIGLPFGS